MYLLTTSVNAKYYLLLCIGRVILYVLLLVGLYISFIYVYIVKMFTKKNSNINHHLEFMTMTGVPFTPNGTLATQASIIYPLLDQITHRIN